MRPPDLVLASASPRRRELLERLGLALVVAAVDVAGFGYTEAATQLQIPVGTVMSRLHRGRARLATYAAAA